MARRRVSGGSKLRKQLRRFEPDMRAGIKVAMEQSAKELAAEIASQAPKDEGTMAAAVHYKVSSDGLGANIGYSGNKPGFKMKYKRGGFEALFQEFGTRHHAAQPFIRPSYRAKLKSILDKIDGAVRTAINNIVQS